MRTTRLPSLLSSRYGPLLVIQSAANLLLAVWLYLEYTHNPFMQAYVSNAWASVWPEITIGISAVIVAAVILAFYGRRHSQSLRLGSVQNLNWKTSKNLAIWLDSTCALSVRHHSDQSRKADYSAGNAGDTSRAVFRKWLISPPTVRTRPSNQSECGRLQLIIHLNLLAHIRGMVGVTEVDTDALPYLEEACYYLRKKGLSFQEVSKALEIPEP